MAHSPNLRAALFMAAAMAGFTANDAVTKSLTDEMNAGQIMLVRGIFATLFLAALAYQQGALHAPVRALHPLVLTRGVAEFLSTALFLTALRYLPIGNITAILQSLPLAVTLGAALFLGEPVRWRRWAAILAGFAGVAIIVRPGFEGFNQYALYALACVAMAAVRDLLTRQMPVEIPSLLASTVTTAIVTVFGSALIVPLGGWTPLTLDTTARLGLAALFLIPGTVFLVMAMRTGEIAYVAPFRYTGLIWAVLLGIVFFGETPDAPMLAGAALVVASGLYSLYRETLVNRRRPIASSTVTPMAPDGL